MRGTTQEVAMLADVSGAYSAISSVYQCVTGPLWHEPSSLLLDELESWQFVVDYEIRCQFINYNDILQFFLNRRYF